MSTHATRWQLPNFFFKMCLPKQQKRARWEARLTSSFLKRKTPIRYIILKKVSYCHLTKRCFLFVATRVCSIFACWRRSTPCPSSPTTKGVTTHVTGWSIMREKELLRIVLPAVRYLSIPFQFLWSQVLAAIHRFCPQISYLLIKRIIPCLTDSMSPPYLDQ